jgi:1-acyl-sn-glycerol-3-phosphate acyltransferase
MKALVTAALRALVGLLCRVDRSGFRAVPRRGPLIIVTNHINFLDIPLLYTFLQPRPLIGLVKVETWDKPFTAFLANVWEAIPIRRQAMDREALRSCLRVLQQGKILILAPEGTRSEDGRLRKGRPGTVLLALQSAAPVLPLVHWGGERFLQNLCRLRRTRIFTRAGELFHVTAASPRVGRSEREAMVEQVMRRLAALLPEEYRGVYAERSGAGKAHPQTAGAPPAGLR